MSPEVTTITPLSAAVLLFMIMDPFGYVPVFVAVLKNVDENRRRWV
ncbi:MAG: MarC family protein [Planctomycetota bacterium]